MSYPWDWLFSFTGLFLKCSFTYSCMQSPNEVTGLKPWEMCGIQKVNLKDEEFCGNFHVPHETSLDRVN